MKYFIAASSRSAAYAGVKEGYP